MGGAIVHYKRTRSFHKIKLALAQAGRLSGGVMKNTATKPSRRPEVARTLLAAMERANKLNGHGDIAARAEKAFYSGHYHRAEALCAMVPAA